MASQSNTSNQLAKLDLRRFGEPYRFRRDRFAILNLNKVLPKVSLLIYYHTRETRMNLFMCLIR